MNRRLTRCRHDRRLAGVAAGVAEYFDLDPTLVRILWFLSIFVGGLGLLVYVGLAIIVPLEPLTAGEATAVAGATTLEAGADATGETGHGHSPVADGHRHVERGSGRGPTFVGLALILLGSLALVDVLLPTWNDSWRYLWPAFLVGIGALLVVGAVRRESTES